MSEIYFCPKCGAQMNLLTGGAYCPACGCTVTLPLLDLPPTALPSYEANIGMQILTGKIAGGLMGVGGMKTEQEVLKMFDEFDEKHGVDRTPNYTVKIGNKYVKSLDYSKENGWMYETSDEPVWMSKINAECVITDVIEFIDSIPNENEVTFEVKK